MVLVCASMCRITCENHNELQHADEGTNIEPFKEIKEIFNITTDTIAVEDLQTILVNLSARIQCEDRTDDSCQSTVVSVSDFGKGLDKNRYFPHNVSLMTQHNPIL